MIGNDGKVMTSKKKITGCFVTVEYEVNNNSLRNIELPLERFAELLKSHIPHFIKKHGMERPVFPYRIKVAELEGGNNPWLKAANMLGIEHDSMKTGYGYDMDLYLSVDKPPSKDRILWLLLHEFRHHMQFVDPVIGSCVNNMNKKMLMDYLCQGNSTNEKLLDAVNHVFHEVNPMEVDANMFASEVLDREYQLNKFALTSHTLRWLREKFAAENHFIPYPLP